MRNEWDIVQIVQEWVQSGFVSVREHVVTLELNWEQISFHQTNSHKSVCTRVYHFLYNWLSQNQTHVNPSVHHESAIVQLVLLYGSSQLLKTWAIPGPCGGKTIPNLEINLWTGSKLHVQKIDLLYRHQVTKDSKCHWPLPSFGIIKQLLQDGTQTRYRQISNPPNEISPNCLNNGVRTPDSAVRSPSAPFLYDRIGC